MIAKINLTKWRCLASVTLAMMATYVIAVGSSSSQRGSFDTVRLLDQFPAIPGSGPNRSVVAPAASWTFRDFDSVPDWISVLGMAQARIVEGAISGETTSEKSVLQIHGPFDLPESDVLEVVEIRLRASSGTQVSVAFVSDSELDLDRWIGDDDEAAWSFSSPLVPDDTFRNYRLSSPIPTRSTSVRHVLVRPTNAAGANFEIQSISLRFRKEELSQVPIGIGWYGLSEVYREALASRVPKSHLVEIALPDDPWLEVGVGTLSEVPVTFEVEVSPLEGGSVRAPRTFQRTVAESNRWMEMSLDLSEFAGKRVSINFELRGVAQGTLGFWGNPLVRSKPKERSFKRPRGVVLIWADSLRTDHVQPYGYLRETSPWLQELAADGVMFEDCVSQASWTKPSTASLLTSLYPPTHGVLDFSDRLTSEIDTLPEIFQQAGFATLSLSSILLTGRFSGFHQGFDELHESLSFPDRDSSKTARMYVDRTIEWLERNSEYPFFVFLHVYDPHDPYRPAAPFDRIWAEEDFEEIHESQLMRIRSFIADPLLRRFGKPTQEDLARAKIESQDFLEPEIAWYDGAIRGMDSELRRLFDYLVRQGISEDTLVVFAADHGEEFLDHGRTFHGQGLYRELIQVPLILSWPGGLPRGVARPETVQVIDLMPTLLDLFGLAPPAGLQGQSVVPLLRGDPDRFERRPAISFKAEVKELLAPPPRETEGVAIIEGDWKLIHNTLPAAGISEFELFNRRYDTKEVSNLARERPDLVRRLSALLKEWRRNSARSPGIPATPPGQEFESEDLRRLRSLGYLPG